MLGVANKAFLLIACLYYYITISDIIFTIFSSKMEKKDI